MTIRAGTRLGAYEILSPLGAGAMGEIYRAKDSRLGREAAIKVLPSAYASDPESLKRFEKEARAASGLNHPNIVTVYEVGQAESVSFIAMELVDGKSLRELIAQGPLPLRRTLEIAGQIAEGLAAAHARGLVHRDLKPQNVMVTREGLVKILDFGLAKQVSPAALGSEDGAPAGDPSLTTPGTILGTVGYMSPEQARGEPADFRSDQFSFGLVLYEMTSGKRAFDRGSAIETLSAILRDEPSPLVPGPTLPAQFCWIVERCLVKEPEGRYASTRDLAWDLKSVWGHIPSTASGAAAQIVPPGRRVGRALAGVAALLAVGLLGALAGRRLARPDPLPAFEQLTFRRGTVWSARFAPDGQSVLYAAAWDGEPFRLYRKGPHSAASLALAFPDANLLAVSRSGQLAASLRPRAMVPGGLTAGTLALAPLDGGAPREVENDVLYADWSPKSDELAVVRLADGKTVLEFPLGKKIFETDGLLTYPRVSPKGDLVAVLDHPTRTDDRGTVAVIDRQGRKRAVSGEWATEQGLAWHPGGEEIWFGAAPFREAHAIYAVTLSGKARVVVRAPGDLVLLDISADGRALVTREAWRLGIMVRTAGQKAEREVSWLDSNLLTGLSADGERLLFTLFGPSVDAAYEGYVRRLEEPSPMFLGEGFAQALSPDGGLVLSMLPTAPPELYVRPTGAGAGQPRKIVPLGLEAMIWADWFPDGKRIVIAGTEPGHGVRLYVCELESGQTRAITPEGILVDHYQGFPVSPDGERVAAMLADGRLAVFPTDGRGEGVPIPNLAPGSVPAAWAADGRRLFVYRLQELPARVLRVDTVTGTAEPAMELRVSDAAGVHGFPSVRLTADGDTCAYSFFRALSELYLVEGLK